MKPLRISRLAFDSAVMESDIPVFLLFGALWDDTCRDIHNHFPFLAEKYDTKMKFVFVDYEYVPDIFSRFKIGQMGVMMIIEDGEIFETRTEYRSAQDLYDFINHFFGVLPY